MKTIRVTYTPSGPSCDPDAVLGYQGDHKAAELLITPPDVPDVSFWRLDWQLPGGTTHSTGALTPVDGAIWYMIPSGLTVEAGYVNAQLKAFRQNGAEIVMQMGSAKLQFFVPPSLPGGDIPAEDVEPLAEALADCRDATSEALDGAQEAREAAAQLPQYVEQAQGFAEDAEESKDGAADIYNQLQNQIGTTICPLDVNHKVPIGNMQALAMMDCIQIDSESDLTALTLEQVQTNDIAYTVEIDGESGNYRLADSWRLLGTGDPSVRANWIRDTTAWAAQAAWALQAAVAIDTNKVNGRPQYSMTQSEYDAIISAGTYDPNADYDVVPD